MDKARVVKPFTIERPDYSNGPFVPVPFEVQIGKLKHQFGGMVWWQMCGRKRAYFHIRDASNRCWIIGQRKRGMMLLPYQCPFCEWWHIGHTSMLKRSTKNKL